MTRSPPGVKARPRGRLRRMCAPMARTKLPVVPKTRMRSLSSSLTKSSPPALKAHPMGRMSMPSPRTSPAVASSLPVSTPNTSTLFLTASTPATLCRSPRPCTASCRSPILWNRRFPVSPNPNTLSTSSARSNRPSASAMRASSSRPRRRPDPATSSARYRLDMTPRSSMPTTRPIARAPRRLAPPLARTHRCTNSTPSCTIFLETAPKSTSRADSRPPTASTPTPRSVDLSNPTSPLFANSRHRSRTSDLASLFTSANS
mmetsp:Transcript_12601/g.29448  ORF Transcript_12601/g.29448 Transcript_12601/m.29448 type:complete len:260 (-) Transcript_12601:648-1427(-)